MKSSTRFYLILAVVAVVAVFLSTACDLAFFGPTAGTAYYAMKIGAYALCYAAFVLSRRGCAALFRRDLGALASDPKRYEAVLAGIGHVPLSTFLLFFVFSIPAVAVSTVAKSLFVPGADAFLSTMIDSSLTAYLSAFIYVFLDKTGLDHLVAAKITTFPSSLREPRQRRKNLIIPMFMSIMAFLVAITAILGTGGSENGLSPLVLPIGAVYQFLVLVLVLIWSKNTAFLYNIVLQRLEQIASSRKELTGRVAIASVDEISSMSGFINSFVETLQRSFSELKDSYDRLGSLLSSLFAGVEESSRSTRDVAGRIDDIRALVAREDLSVGEANEAGTRLSSQVSAIGALVTGQNREIRETVMSAEMGLAAISGANQKAIEVRHTVESLMESFERGGEAVRESLKAVRNITDRSKKLSELNSTIAKIASQTNLLAMNAAIEAAHAGEAGAGFSVVADEIRALAENTSQRTKDSRESLGAILSDIQTALAVSTETEAAYSAMREALSQVDGKTKDISDNLSSQDSMNKAILDALRASIARTEETAATAKELIEETGRLASALEGLSEAAKDTTSRTDEMHANTMRALEAISRLGDLSRQATELTERTSKLVEDFKV